MLGDEECRKVASSASVSLFVSLSCGGDSGGREKEI